VKGGVQALDLQDIVLIERILLIPVETVFIRVGEKVLRDVEGGLQELLRGEREEDLGEGVDGVEQGAQSSDKSGEFVEIENIPRVISLERELHEIVEALLDAVLVTREKALDG
jgi:hypothetical protein